ncbi:MAG: FAD-dependent oxidoreductase, partial [Bacillota bacterium]
RRMTLEGARVKMVLELMPYSGGLKRNIVQCLDDFAIPLYLSHTVTKLHGKHRLQGVSVAGVDERGVPKAETEYYVPCDTLLLSVGLIPENELSRGMGVMLDPATGGPAVDAHLQTSVPGVFACGNAVQVHDLVDFVTEEAMRAGASAAKYALSGTLGEAQHKTIAGCGVRYVVPQRIAAEDATLFFRAVNVYKNCATVAKCGDRVIARRRRQVVTPGEMERLEVKAADITGDVTVSVEEA